MGLTSMSSISLLKALTEAGIASRRWLADAIRQGRVELNGKVAEDFNHPVNLKTDIVSVDGRLIDISPERMVYLIINKPAGVLSTTSDEKGRRTVLHLLPERYRRFRLYPAGRLDKDTTGLILLTNDGELVYQLTHPRFGHEKEYVVLLDKRLKPHERRRLECGLKLDDGMTHPALVRKVGDASDFSYSITIHEGRKRQVRRMFQSLGHRVIALKRIRIGRVCLCDLEEGEMRELSDGEVEALLSYNAVGGRRLIP